MKKYIGLTIGLICLIVFMWAMYKASLTPNKRQYNFETETSNAPIK